MAMKPAPKKKSKAPKKAAKTKSARPAPRASKAARRPKPQLKKKLQSKPKPKTKRAAPKKSASKKAKKTVKAPIKKTKKAEKASPKKAATRATAPAAKSKNGSKGPGVEKVAAASQSAARKTYVPEIDRPTGMYGGVLLSANPKPFPKKSPYSKEELSDLKKALVHERDRLRRELATMEGMTMGTAEGELESPGFPTHIAEYAAHMSATETLLGVRSLEEERLEQVEEALRRIEEKRNYGLCLACGEKIGIERLVAKPHAHLCMDCRRLYERSRGLPPSQ
jgi:RNA polymerase-binding transcription factor DksA